LGVGLAGTLSRDFAPSLSRSLHAEATLTAMLTVCASSVYADCLLYRPHRLDLCSLGLGESPVLYRLHVKRCAYTIIGSVEQVTTVRTSVDDVTVAVIVR